MTNVIQNVYPKDLTMSLASNHVEREKKLFISLPLKKQKKPKIDRKAMEKKSKKINRRK